MCGLLCCRDVVDVQQQLGAIKVAKNALPLLRQPIPPTTATLPSHHKHLKQTLLNQTPQNSLSRPPRQIHSIHNTSRLIHPTPHRVEHPQHQIQLTTPSRHRHHCLVPDSTLHSVTYCALLVYTANPTVVPMSSIPTLPGPLT